MAFDLEMPSSGMSVCARPRQMPTHARHCQWEQLDASVTVQGLLLLMLLLLLLQLRLLPLMPGKHVVRATLTPLLTEPAVAVTDSLTATQVAN